MDIFSATHIHLTGIKGVAMTSLAQCLIDMGKTVTGSDVDEDFVTKEMLSKLNIKIFPILTKDLGKQSPNSLTASQPELLIYTSAHGGPSNPEVLWAVQNQIPTLSHAEALGQLFNAKKGIAVCGVGGKSTTSAMITWVLNELELNPSFSVGVGKIIGMARTGRWVEESEYFVAEADEYVIDPKGNPVVPRFSFLKPQIVVCTNIAHDHPDVYPTFEDTKKAFHDFFMNLKDDGLLIVNGDDAELLKLANDVKGKRVDIQLITYGTGSNNNAVISNYQITEGKSVSQLSYNNEQVTVSLKIPGIFNHLNAVGAMLASLPATQSLEESAANLAEFQSTQRRFEYKGEKNGVKYYDDYAHHPSEIKATIEALNQWHPDQRKVIAFQPHTFSRTKSLFTDFVNSFSQASEVILLDIFASARENFDPSISSDLLASETKNHYPSLNVVNVHDVSRLAQWCQMNLHPGDILITLGAGDIYQVHDKI